MSKTRARSDHIFGFMVASRSASVVCLASQGVPPSRRPPSVRPSVRPFVRRSVRPSLPPPPPSSVPFRPSSVRPSVRPFVRPVVRSSLVRARLVGSAGFRLERRRIQTNIVSLPLPNPNGGLGGGGSLCLEAHSVFGFCVSKKKII